MSKAEIIRLRRVIRALSREELREISQRKATDWALWGAVLAAAVLLTVAALGAA